MAFCGLQKLNIQNSANTSDARITVDDPRIMVSTATLLNMDKILLIDKPAGMTSHDVVDRVRHIFKTRSVGHAGTLDPFATGLLILGVGTATKRLSEYVGLDKTYEATAHLGTTSSTFDLEGVITETVGANGVRPGARRAPLQDIEDVLNQFRGGYEQKAPIFSAKKIHGKKLYELARRGQATEEMRPTKRVTIDELTVLDYHWPELKFRARCSSGTYIRSLADDLGRALGCGAYLTELRRTAIGSHRIEDATSLETLSLRTEAASEAWREVKQSLKKDCRAPKAFGARNDRAGFH